VVDVKLSLKITHARGKYYVYRRSDGEAILRGFTGNMEALRKRLAEPDMIGLYNSGRRRDTKAVYPEKSLGWLVAWFTDPEQCADFKALAETTREEYADRLKFLEEAYDDQIADITTADIYEARDNACAKKWPAYADKMVTALSTMFKLAVKRNWMTSNPAPRRRQSLQARPARQSGMAAGGMGVRSRARPEAPADLLHARPLRWLPQPEHRPRAVEALW
jgi:hypothetical protein